ncbi:hypothetical protein K435DRAFT_877385 [Dendrothele bispora CBS 962.96]|uniref:Uncharacterized protein n=1 Tax=Dendrothele bispora (strain CBS 962.96) TaxID=1314807 RepID=A0A4S8KR13_DENBC|nr:hypothetical protein K435DRAFT_877385 [Dendrothele bispora CBS 962.96]
MPSQNPSLAKPHRYVKTGHWGSPPHLEVTTEDSISLPLDSADQEDDSDDEELEDVDSNMRNQLNKMIENIDNVYGLRKDEENQLDACSLASVAISLQEIGNMTLPKTHPKLQLSKNTSLVLSRTRNATLLVEKPISDGNPLVYHLQDITTDDITPLASIRHSHQTIQAQNGVRNANSESKANTSESTTTSHRRELAQKMHAILRQADERGSSTGLNRKIRFTATDKSNETTTTTLQKPGGNSANAEVAARGRAFEVIKRRREIFKKNVKMHNVISEAMVSKSTLISRGTYGFIVSGEKILLGQVTSLYSKGGGKVGMHSWVTSADSIGALSYISAQLYEPSGRRKQFNTVHVDYATVLGRGLRRFAHVPSNSFLVLVAKDNVAVVNNGVQLSDYAWALYQDLLGERAEIVGDVAALNKRRRTKKGVSEDVEDEVDETYH